MEYNGHPIQYLEVNGHKIASFVSDADTNFDADTVKSFGEEWKKFDRFSAEEITNAGDQYFDVVTNEMMNEHSTVLDVGCGTGRWSKYVASRVKFVEGIDPSEAVYSAAQLNSDVPNFRVTHAGVDSIPFADGSFDFVFCLGVLHHIPDTKAALEKAVKKVKPGGHFLLYLYYKLDNRGPFFKFLFSISTLFRKIISSFPSGLKKFSCDVIAITVYMPFVLLARLVKGINPKGKAHTKIPLSYYTDKSFNIIRNDALDRFGTPLEKRFTKAEVVNMMEAAGLNNITVSSGEPYWHAVGKKD